MHLSSLLFAMTDYLFLWRLVSLNAYLFLKRGWGRKGMSWVKFALLVIGAILAIGGIGVLVITLMDREVRGAIIKEVDLTRVEDGIYRGIFHSGRWKNEVEVTVKDHQLVSIKNTRPLPDNRAQNIVEQAITELLTRQSIAIDAISGASLNTRSFQLAVKEALTEGKATK